MISTPPATGLRLIAGARGERGEMRRSPRSLPLGLGLARAVGRRFLDFLLNRVDDRIRIVSRRHLDPHFVPEPLPRRREVEVVPLDGEAVGEA